jgi:uncharacterized protein YjiS (DUF1127 family)
VRELEAMSYRELRDIGLTGFDVQHLAWGGEAPGRPWQDAAQAETGLGCECQSGSAADDDTQDNETRPLEGLAHLELHVLKDIGAPHWLVARAAGEPDREHLRWIALEHR